MRLQFKKCAIDFYLWIGFGIGTFIGADGSGLNHYLRLGFAEVIW